MSIIQNLKNYFSSKTDGNSNQKAPKGICPNCWETIMGRRILQTK